MSLYRFASASEVDFGVRAETEEGDIDVGLGIEACFSLYPYLDATGRSRDGVGIEHGEQQTFFERDADVLRRMTVAWKVLPLDGVDYGKVHLDGTSPLVLENFRTFVLEPVLRFAVRVK